MPLDPTGLVSHLPRQHREVSWKQPCWAASTGNITLTAPGASIDGVTMAVGYRFLAKDQSTASQNGIYRWTGAATAAVRDFDMDQDANSAVPAQEVAGAMVAVIAGTVNAGRIYRCTNTATVQLGVDDITFTELASGTSLILPVDHGNMGATETLDLTAGDWHRGTLDQACAITVTGFVVDQGGVMIVELDGDFALSWDPDVDFGGGDDQPNASGATLFLLTSSQGNSVIYGAKFGGGGSPASTVEDETTLGITPAVGTDTEYARQSHTHGSPSAATIAAAVSTSGFVGQILISDTPSTPLVFADLIQNEAQDDLVYADV